MLFDTHAHLDDGCFQEDRAQLLAGLEDKGVGLVMNPGCSLAASRNAVALAEQYPFVWASVGSHPDDADQVNGKLLDQYRRLAAHEKVMAIGEIGLDYHYVDVPRARQIIAFEEQIELAEALKLPVIVHMREAWQDAMEIVRRHPDLRGVFHCFSGSKECALWLAERGWYVGFTGVVTFKNARKAVECVEALPLEQILIETDCPYMAPEPHRGRRNDSRYVPLVAQKIAQIKGLETEEVAHATAQNAMRLFGIK